MSITTGGIKIILIYARIFGTITIETLISLISNFCSKFWQGLSETKTAISKGVSLRRRWYVDVTTDVGERPQQRSRDPQRGILFLLGVILVRIFITRAMLKRAGWMRKQWRIFLKLTSHTRITRPILIYRGLLSLVLSLRKIKLSGWCCNIHENVREHC